MHSDRLYQLALWLTPGVGDMLTRLLMAHCGSAEAVFKLPPGKLQKIRGIGDLLSRNIAAKSTFVQAEQLLEQALREAVEITAFNEEGYPQRLKSVYDAPALLFSKGKGSVNPVRSVGIVGTRRASEYGKKITEEIVEQLVPYRAAIISGLAYGIDITAHKAALKHDLPTFGVMANGLDLVYPAVHQKTALQMQEKGGLFSEQTLGTQPDRRFFLDRNRIIAGLSDVVIVIESAVRGGAMGTAEYANNYNRDVFAVPGNLTSPNSEGCNSLIARNKATIFTSVPQMIETLGWQENGEPLKMPTLDLSRFSQEESQIIRLFRDSGAMHVDDLAWKSQLPMSRLASLLLNLEFQGFIKSLPGKVYGLA
ncbi:DNA-protecting protein DprA [Siphonobacter sp. BAB-5405]|uniref:DNA-processing protein DprA n=1 Tax=Siphonobacter sp. BAB-5405 TaxID=1864825 RepID=UPI000C7FEC9B|nr:DNA-processing protein DprA [Siphonobacter sp. BAB-5405]PMD98367.1 DNA-protecting protein DprA [Siphonobacter sp. BAB-5405]